MASAKRPSRSAHGAQQNDGAVDGQISKLQRARILSAMLDVSAQRGAGSVTVAHIVERSGVSRRTFYEQFTDRDHCFLTAFEQALAFASERVLPAYEAEKAWPERIRAGLMAFLAFCDEQPYVARMLVYESQTSGGRVAQRRSDLLASLTRVLDQGRTLTGTGKSGKATNVSPLTAEGTLGGVLAVIQGRLLACPRTGEAKPKPLISLTNELMSMIVLPYLGAPAARRELHRHTPKPQIRKDDGEPVLSDPFKDLGMRITYRTVRVLMAIDQHPDGSNRMIGETAGMTDQGQISKLLSRLERIGLVSNTGIHPGKGAPNSWTLTEKGLRVAENIRANTEGSQSNGARER